MQYFGIQSLAHENIDCVVIPVLGNGQLSGMRFGLDETTQAQLTRIVEADLNYALAKTVMFYASHLSSVSRVLVVACNEKAVLSKREFIKLITAIAEEVKRYNIQSLCCYLEEIAVDEGDLAWKVSCAIEYFEAALYQFDRFKSKPNASPALSAVYFYREEKDALEVERACFKGIAIAEGMHMAKDLANTPANYATPTKVAEHTENLFKEESALAVEVYDEHHATVKAMGGLLGVSQGSNEAPRLLVVKYTPPILTRQDTIALVGKGVTFDAGGISIKPSSGMEEMKFDMAGAASVLGTLKAIAMLKMPVPVVGILPLTENLLNGSALKPGDVITMFSGQTVEVLNTDAEGRLILADALTYSRRFNPAIVVDIATLTGAVEVALGNIASGLMTNDEELRGHLEVAADRSMDRVWSLPLWEDYQSLIDSNVADVANLGQRGAGTVTAACFLARFTEGLRWAHLDIAGTAYVSGRQKTATGRPVPLLVNYILDYCSRLKS